MGIEFKVSGIKTEEMTNPAIELSPRHQCKMYVQSNGGTAILVTQQDFDSYMKENKFEDGPFRDSFGDGSLEPYNPYRQAFGKLNIGKIVYCELSEELKQKSEKLLNVYREDLLELNLKNTNL
ncbi:hypothetical protein GOV14_05855 [Candidatus Pacearchaeota archaeon]|nr:hypothetical protein [Candidatus Pacearchaeota archaeon]